MEQNNDTQQAPYTPLSEIAETEYRARVGLQTMFKDPHAGLSLEERKATLEKNHLRHELTHSVNSFFSIMASDKLPSPKQLIVLPLRLAKSGVIGSDYAIKVLVGMIDLTEILVADYRREISKLLSLSRLNIEQTALKLLQDKYIGSTTTYAEVVFLSYLCTWLGVGTNSLALDVSSIVEKAKTDNTFTFQKPILEEEFLPGLRNNVTQQYSFLEQLLQRL
jgi:hypothetical protein